MKVLVSGGSKHGATLEIARAIGDELARFGHEATVAPPEDVDGISGIGAAVIGSGVYAGHWLPTARQLVEKNAAELAEIPVWLFSSGPVGDPPKPEEDPVDVVGLMTMVKAVDHRVFSGRIDLDKLGFAERAVVKALRAPVGDFRDWDAITAWAGEIARALASPSPDMTSEMMVDSPSD
ncbi:MAG: flavodoxin domain-containing protein [Acidimicrobiia bacterium]